jgi:hypothetical protein
MPRKDSDAGWPVRSSRADGRSVATSATARLSVQQRMSAQRELARLLNKLAEDLTAAAAATPALGLKLYRSPGRCVMQGSARAVSVSWFPTSFADTTVGDLQVIEWRGVVSLPGTRYKGERGATVIEARVFRPVCSAAGEWCWERADGDLVCTTGDLAFGCLCRLLFDDGSGTPPAARS